MRLAAIDCGTNTIRLLIGDYELTDQGIIINELERSGEIVRLGVGVDRTGRLDEEAIERTLDFTRACAERFEHYGVQQARFVATSASRDAANRDVFVNGVWAILGFEPEVISGEEEAALAFLGSKVGSNVDMTHPRLVVDLGGGSTEFSLGTQYPDAYISTNMGSGRVTERFLSEGVTPASETAAREFVRSMLDTAAEQVDFSAAHSLVGLAGTITAVSAHALGLEYFDSQKIGGAQVPVEDMRRSCDAIIHATPEQLAQWEFIAPGRRSVIAAGALICDEMVARVAADTANTDHPVRHINVSLHDILDGIALSQL